MAAATRIARLTDLSDRARALADLNAIFFETSRTQHFDSPAARAAFRERWLGRYLTHFLDESFVAVTESGAVAGYLVGCLEDPVGRALFRDLSYLPDFSHLMAHFPAHLHINVSAGFRSQGIGARLIAAFAGHAARAGVPGMHAVTGAGARNNRFYEACGFRHLAATDWNGSRIAFFGRTLTSRDGQPEADFHTPAASAKFGP